MTDVTTIEVALVLLGVWLATIPLLWLLIGRRGRPGPLKGVLAKEACMLTHMATLLAGAAMLIKGLYVGG